ncbi:metal dependent phosphohydrolase [Thioalkalivibrio sulfidiphilus HL-EbGr7]|uniref:Metal dependent phosphohydrolase n=1 Tax=Thioalkalivibrio sulfidiphilus (strain HL-EbGR7) TaxID=396588 RepID=B8GUK2_THISH|nr:HDOD domain-containing protein [Thioalkalivibrio sulfidiphilus]ACL73322.1 metal dependent phosphohydrolase [Thioalkalivibrio sulfidiphilus HL-EbGr7]
MSSVSDKRQEIQDLLKDLSALVSPPEIIIRLRQDMESPKSTAESLAKIVMQDPNLSARILHMANSAMYGLNHRIETVSRAISIIGQRALYHLALAVSATKTFSKLPSELVNIAVFWRHSVFTALIARNLAQRCHVLHPERLFVGGLLHDIGSLVLYHRYPDILRDSLLAARGNEEVLAQQERELIGFDHAEVGGALMEMWGLPESLQQAVAFHHRPGATANNMEVAIVHLADTLANRTDQGSFSEFGAFASMPHPGVWKTLGLDEDITEDLWRDVNMQFMETLHVILPQAK